MELLIPDKWLREFLNTKATPKQIAEYLSLCGPSVDKVTETEFGPVYSIEVTTNRVDSASVYGIAREASAILPRFGVKATLEGIESKKFSYKRRVDYLDARIDPKLCPRFSAVLIKNVKVSDSPTVVKDRLKACGVRPLNNVVDISNYVMIETGQPTHTFDYDKIEGSKMILRGSYEGEKITTLDGKTHTLQGGDIVIEDGKGSLIDLAGIMGGANSAVDQNTKNVLFFVQTYNPLNIRRTSMSLAHRTQAAVLFEKGLDPEQVSMGISRGIELFKVVANGVPDKDILDIYPKPYKPKKIICDLDFIKDILGTLVSKSEVDRSITPLGFKTKWLRDRLEVAIPSFRANDIQIPEDVVEEVARIYGYHNLPSRLPEGIIPDQLPNASFYFEKKIKNFLASQGGVEAYTLSLVSKEMTKGESLRLRNPLGSDSEYLRTSLLPSLVTAASQNKGEDRVFHLFEMANVYIPNKGSLPQEELVIAGIFYKYPYREAKGMLEALFSTFHIETVFVEEDSNEFLPSHRVIVKVGAKILGQFGVLENGYFYYEFIISLLKEEAKEFSPYLPIPKYPPQIEDVTFTLPTKTRVGEVLHSIKDVDPHVSDSELTDIYNDSYTFRVWYQHPTKTLNDNDVALIRARIIKLISSRFGGIVKD